MGLMDNIKKAQEMAQQAQQQHGDLSRTAMPDAADMEYAQTANKIAQGGRPGVATIKSISEAGKDELGGPGKRYAIDVAIELESGDSYDTTIQQALTDDAINSGHYQAGKRFEVKVDPDDRSKALLYGLAG